MWGAGFKWTNDKRLNLQRMNGLWTGDSGAMPVLFASADYAPVFAAGPSGTGIPFHSHQSSFLHLLYGKKRWFLYPPDSPPPFSPTKLQTDWVQDVLPKLLKKSQSGNKGAAKPPLQSFRSTYRK